MPMSVSKESGAHGKMFCKVDNPMSLFPILESRLPLSCCLVNQLLAYDKFKNNFDAYTFEDAFPEEPNGIEVKSVDNDENLSINKNESNSKLWILFKYRREDWNCCITISSPTPNAAEISPQVKYALEFSNILNWGEPFVLLNLDLNVSDFLVNLNIRKLGNVIKIFPCYLFHMDPEDAAKIEVPSPTDPTVTVAPLDPIKGVEFFKKHWDYMAPGTEEFVLNCLPKQVSAGVYLASGEVVCAALVAPYGNICTLVTHENHRRKGYASIVMRYILRELGKQGFHPCLETAITNHAGVALHTSYIPKIIAKTDYICHKAL